MFLLLTPPPQGFQAAVRLPSPRPCSPPCQAKLGSTTRFLGMPSDQEELLEELLGEGLMNQEEADAYRWQHWEEQQRV